MSTTPEHHSARLAVAEEILSLMGRRRISQTTLGKQIGLGQPSISKRLSGELAFTTDELFDIAAFFDVEVTRLLGGVGQGGSSLRWMTTPEDGRYPLYPVTPVPGQLDLLCGADTAFAGAA